MIPTYPGLWRVRYREGFTRDFRVVECRDHNDRPALCVIIPGSVDPPGTVKAFTEILGTFGAVWEGPTPFSIALPPKPS